MDLKTAVFNAARDGKLKLLQKLLENKSDREVLKLMAEKTNGATPLLMASRYGHLELVEFLMECCCAPVELGGSVNFDGEVIEGAPPLWAASAAGHLKVVQSLLGHGASVNNTTLTNSTPLRAACFDGHLDIVRYLVEHQADLEVANRHGHTCLMISCYKGHREIAQFLLEKGADVNRRSVKGNTALHDCAESGSLEIMKMLLKFGASMEKDGYGMTPLLSASVTGHTNIVDFLTAHPQTGLAERISALELLGATFVDKKRDLLGALQYWKRAMELRHSEADCMRREEPLEPEPAYDCSREVSTAEELDGLIADPDDMRMQALLIRERILGPAHPDTSYYIRYRGAVYADSGNFERCIRLWKYALDMQQSNLEPLSPMTASSLLSFAELFSFMLQDRAKGLLGAGVSFQQLMEILCRSVLEIERAVKQPRPSPDPDPAQLSKLLSIILHLICLLEKLPCSPEQDQHKKETIYRFLKLQACGRNGFSPLHLAVDHNTTCVGRYPVCKFPSLQVASVLLECGADVNSRDLDDNSPLHVAASNNHPDIMKLLISGGTHFDSTNALQQTACDLLDHTQLAKSLIQPINHTTLQCLAARAIIRHRLVYRGSIPERLEAFVLLHR
ncbi:protein fem-1 homolog C [Danio rerio]|uniref:Protein fem-1 homolog C n=1 Tax=Danio rerio TaxID=7955 RepID=FEM1C_DANRE|nr:protein fem-1 homolog C [Danio rerio]Q7T3P8.2 RecName: Full=Protein fem-1 homolog C; Short=FEM1c; AltName: Full=FEM1-gamma [Danio rerio]AAH56774.1 Fem-1 homolog c (C.elegans) [Danio rerio]|eukprot:NP_937788.2 protein fem-1 homolog C [Danio rerio]